jgi:hypothetical protein
MFKSNDIRGRAGKLQVKTGSLHSRIQMGNAMHMGIMMTLFSSPSA